MSGHNGLLPSRSAFDLPRIAPDHLCDAEQRKDPSIEDPMLVPDHEPDPERQVESLQNPNRTHGDHYDAEESADDSHDDIERGAHRFSFASECLVVADCDLFTL
jgi:hypothetical protein